MKKAKPSSEARPPFSQPKEQQSKWKTKMQLTEESLEAELDQHKRPKYKVSGTGGLCGGSPLLSPFIHHQDEQQHLLFLFKCRSRRNCFSLANTGFSHFFFCSDLGNVMRRGEKQTLQPD